MCLHEFQVHCEWMGNDDDDDDDDETTLILHEIQIGATNWPIFPRIWCSNLITKD